MGYYTFIDLSYDVGADEKKDVAIQTWIDEHAAMDYFEDIYPAGASGLIKNITPDPELITLSRAFPEVLFTLHGSGEEPEDLWITYFLDGLTQEAPATVTYPPFDPQALAEPHFEEATAPVPESGQ